MGGADARPAEPAADPASLRRYVLAHGIDFLDFGCSDGASLEHARLTFGANLGLGIDIDPVKVSKAKAAGHHAIVADVADLPLPADAVAFVTMIHFVEHLPGFAAAVAAIASAMRVARQFVYIRHPWFDSDAFLLERGFKFYWSDWVGHPLHFDRLAFVRAMNLLQHPQRWVLFGRNRIRSVADPAIIPLLSPVDSFAADTKTVAQREPLAIVPTAYREVGCLIEVGDRQRFDDALHALDERHVILDRFEGMRRCDDDTESS
jgi:SAM-dependent methyltransferase